MFGLFVRLWTRLSSIGRLPLTLVVAVAMIAFGAGCGRSDFEDDPTAITDSGRVDADADVLPDGVVLERVVVEPNAVTLPVGIGTKLQAFAVYSDGRTEDVTAFATWSSDAPGRASVSAGTVVGVSPGSARISATYSGRTGVASVFVNTLAIVDLRVDPPTADLPVGGTAKFTATAIFSDGSSADVTSTAAWSVFDPTVLKVTTGVVTALKPGDSTVQAVLDARSANARVNVVGGKVVTSVEISPTDPLLGIGGEQPLVATAIYSDGSKADVTTTATWAVGDGAVGKLAITPTKVSVFGVGAGSTSLTATFSGVTGKTTLKVTSATLTGVTVSPSAATIFVGASVGLTATANYSDGTAVDVTATALWSTSDGALATVAGGLVKGLGAGTATITASYSTAKGTAAITVSPAKLLAITISPVDSSAPLGSKPTLKATGTYEGGVVKDVTNDVAWSTDDGAIATVSNATGSKGQVSPLAVGKTTVRAKLDGVEGSTSITVTKATLSGITITPNPVAATAGTKQFLKATASYSDGSTIDVTTTCTWATGSAAIATVSNATGAQGLLSAVAVGSTTVTCQQSGVTGTATVNVTGATLDQVVVAPINPTCRVGETIAFNATAISTAGTSTNVTGAATWKSSNTTVLSTTPGPANRFRCAAKGTSTVSATYLGKTGTTTVTVSDAVVVSITVDPAALTLGVGAFQQYQATAIFSDGTSINVTGAATWVSSAPAVAAIGDAGANKGRLQTLSAGSTTIKATYAGISGSTPLTVSSAVITAIQLTPAAGSVPAGVSFGFQATAIYSDGSSKPVTGLATWVSSNSSVLAVSNAGATKGNATSIAAGTATVSATYGGFTGKATIVVTKAKLVTVQITPFKPSLPVGYGVRMVATGVWDDGFTLNVTGQATWTTSNGSIAAVSDAIGNKGRVTPIAAGTATISAQYAGVVGTNVVTVTSATLVSIAVGPTAPTVAVGGSQQLVATGTFSDGSTLDIADYVGWSSSNTALADVSNAADTKGVAYGFAVGTVTVTATRGAVTGTATLTVK